MRYSYSVVLWADTRGESPEEVMATQVHAQDRYDAVAQARRYVEQQHPQIDLARIDTWFVAKRLA